MPRWPHWSPSAPNGCQISLLFRVGSDVLILANFTSFDFTFTEISDSQIAFLDTKVYKGERFNRDSTLDVQTHYKQTETFQYANFYSCHPPGVKEGFIKGEALRFLRTNSSHSTFDKNMQSFITSLKNRGYPNECLEKHLFEVNFKDRERSLENKDKSTKKKILNQQVFWNRFHYKS